MSAEVDLVTVGIFYTFALSRPFLCLHFDRKLLNGNRSFEAAHFLLDCCNSIRFLFIRAMNPIKIFLASVLAMAASSAMSGPTTINFDGTGASCYFSGSSQLTSKYAASGVTFSNNTGGAEGGAILNQCGGFGFNAHSGTDFLAYNTSSKGVDDVLTMTFGSAMGSVSIWVADTVGEGASLRMQAFDATHALVSSAKVSGSRVWQQMTVSGAGITSVVLSGGRIGAFDDLSFNTAFTVSEPGVLALVGLGLLGVGFSRRRAV
nr:PEP-CTERM sorting domain-containing protein [uncultured Roseateles sp.]